MIRDTNDKQNIQMLNASVFLQDEEEETTSEKTGISCLFTYRCWKSILDRILAFLAMLISSPLLVIFTIMIHLDSPGNAIFRQERVGKGGRKFIFYKFRSMYQNHDDSEYYRIIERYVRENKVPPPRRDNQNNCDPRVTRLGRMLRKTNLDEIPQLFNILKGDMSFVGPRPMIPFMVNMYNDHHKKVFEVKPGLTGLWQASGRKRLSFEDMIRLDMEYIKKQSLFLDIKIIFLTIVTLIRGEGS
jgi:lipopolysaccharide/colanic/teichoic acid biosynthesis glycosyltransferase